MKRPSLIIVVLMLAAVSLVQYRLIGASLVSLAAFCVLEAGNRAPFGGYWNAALFEYWFAGIVWVVTALWLLRSLIVSIRKRRKEGNVGPEVPSTTARPWGASAGIIGLVGYIALTSPFLTLIEPNVQGSLVTTRLLPPLSVGYVRELPDPGSVDPDTAGRLHRAFADANNYLLHRTVLVSGDPPVDSQSDGPRAGAAIRQFRTVFIFGTDDNARDVFSRVVAGARVSLGIGITAALGALLIGGAVGFAAGMSRGVLDGVLMRLTDLFLAIPSLFLVIGILAFVGQSIVTIVVVLSLSGWMGIARVVRGEVVSLREREFILAAKLLRVSTWKIITRHLLPNLRPVIVTATVLQFASAVLGEASLGFLGLGIQPPTATWGNMMGEATGYLASAWWIGLFPGILLAVVLVAAHSMGENLAVDRNPDMAGN
ncbi:MAG TPA: ABC transporter permease [Bacteroidota bacterium]